jgi:hypothetical protein
MKLALIVSVALMVLFIVPSQYGVLYLVVMLGYWAIPCYFAQQNKSGKIMYNSL